MILVFLVVLWVVVLGPTVLRRRAEHNRDSVGSVGAFRRQLRILGRSEGPPIVEPVHRLAVAQRPVVVPINASGLPVITSRGGLSVIRTTADQASSHISTGEMSREFEGGSVEAPSIHRANETSDPYFRSGACKRRRDVLMVLVTIVGTTGLLGMVPPLRMALTLTAVSFLALVAYVGLLVYLRNLAAERQAKLRYLPQPIEHESLVAVRQVAVR